MSPQDTKRQIVEAVENSSEPALSAKQIAERIDVAVKTIHNNITNLVESGQLSTVEIGNATAYYADRIRDNSSTLQEHQCVRCGRSLRTSHDLVKVDVDESFQYSRSISNSFFLLFCRFCYSDFKNWAGVTPGETGSYPDVHGWEIPFEQLRDIQEDDSRRSSPDIGPFDETERKILDIVSELEQKHEYNVAKSDAVFTEYGAETEIERKQVKSVLDSLHSQGFLGFGDPGGYFVAKDASTDDYPDPPEDM